MSMQPIGYNLPSDSNVTVHNCFPYWIQTKSVTTASAKFWATLSQGMGGTDDAYEGFTGRLHEVMHHRSWQAEY